MRTRLRALSLLAALAALLLAAAPVQAAVPHQFLAKIYTEALGRAPDQTGWQGGLNHFNANGCSKATLKSWGRTVYLSTEYNNLGYDNAAKVLTLYRGILNREPDSSGFTNYYNLLNGGTPLSTLVDGLFDSAELGGLVTAICNNDSYFFGGAPVIDIPVGGGGFQGTQAQLQSQLNATPSGGTVALAQKAVIRLASTLTIPAGVTLTTTGSPTHYKYALMGRLVRDSLFNATAVKLQPGAKLKNVWVDGARGRLGFNQGSLNVQLFGGTGTTVSQCVISNTAGWSSLQALGSAEGQACGGNTIANNLVTVYSSNHNNCTWADGLSIACENATVEFNEILDATDVPIVVFRAAPAVQRSQVRNNTLVAAGNSAYGGLVADPLYSAGGTKDFTGASINNNTLWSGRGHFDIGISVGTRAWFGTASDMGTGVSFTFNTTGSQSMKVDMGIGVSGMINATVQSNTLAVQLTNPGNCPNYSVGASVSAGYASGSLQPYTDVLIQGCIGHVACP